MTLTELRYVVAVARERHFGRAAESCFVSQPTLSVAVRKLEDELGVALFERRSHEVAVTKDGREIIAQAQRVLDEADVIRQLAAGAQNQLEGTLRLGLIYTVGPYLLPSLVPVLHEHAPEMSLVIEEGFTETLRTRLASGDLDAIVLALPFHESGVATKPLYEEPFVIVVPQSHPFATREHVSVAELGAEDVLLLGRGHCLRDQVLLVCPECEMSGVNGRDAKTPFSGSSIETIRHMVVTGLGITVLPCTAAGVDRYSHRLLKIVRFEEPVPRRRVALAWRKSFPRPQAIDCLVRSVLDCSLSGVTMIEHRSHLRRSKVAGSE